VTSVGIDFGTTNCVVATYTQNMGIAVLKIDHPPADWAGLGFDRLLPSVYGLDEQNAPKFGWEAKRLSSRKVEAVKRLFATEETVDLGDQTIVVEEVAAYLFAHMKRASAEDGVVFNRAVVTVPANSRGRARLRTKVCAGLGGIEVMALINEPTAAAMAYGLAAHENKRILVFDWGGGTLDVTVLDAVDGIFWEQASSGVQRLGGLDFDRRLEQTIRESVPDADTWNEGQNAMFRLAIERAKILLSSADETNVALPNNEYRRVTRKMFESAVRPLVERCQAPIEQCLADLHMDSGAIDALLLVGGTSKIPAVRGFVSDLLSAEPIDIEKVDPLTAVGEGAAIAAAILSGELQGNDFFVSTEHALGTLVLNPLRGELEFSPIIPRNHKLPAKATASYKPVRDYQDTIHMSVIEGEPDKPLTDEVNVILKEWEVPIPNARAMADASFEITYDYDVDGILHVSIVDPMTDERLLADDVAYSTNQDKRALVQMAGRVQAGLEGNKADTSEVQSSSDPASTTVIERAKTKVIPFLDDEQADHLRDLVGRLQAAVDQDREPLRAELEAELSKYSYLF
jgi:molecular chaperone DnaK